MLEIKEALKELKLTRRPKNSWAYWVNECALLVKRPYLQMANRLKGLPADFIKDLYLQAKSFDKNPVAYFWKLYREIK